MLALAALIQLDPQSRYLALVRGSWPTAKKKVSAPLLKSNLRSGERMVEVNDEVFIPTDWTHIKFLEKEVRRSI